MSNSCQLIVCLKSNARGFGQRKNVIRIKTNQQNQIFLVSDFLFAECFDPTEISSDKIGLRIVKSESLAYRPKHGIVTRIVGGKPCNYDYVCHQCGKSYMRINTLKRHMKWFVMSFESYYQQIISSGNETIRDFVDPRIFRCEGYSMSLWQGLITPSNYSQTLPIGNKNKANMCVQCGKTYVHDFTLRRHMRYECGKPARFCCHYCPHRSKYKANVQQHILQLHKGEPLPSERHHPNILAKRRKFPGPNNFKCIKCGKSYNHVKNLKRHEKYECGMPPKFECYPPNWNQPLHRQTWPTPNTKRNSVACGKCGKSYSTAGNLSRHEKYECGKAPGFRCSECSYKSYYRFNMERHLVITTIARYVNVTDQAIFFSDLLMATYHHPPRYLVVPESLTCHRCAKAYKTPGNLRRHLKYECGKLPRFHCSTCGYQFDEFSGGLWYEPQVPLPVPNNKSGGSSEEGNNVCPRCRKTYIHSRHLKRHMKYECENPRRFCCSYCPHRSNHKIDMQRHIVRRHQGKSIKFYVLK
ncbi:zinc finger protein 761-like [Phymastichus coffea]|uniref:zinc finger protein 761-like n=1 Tax=Phymastichus coffea TaxID=108790 RepID=UPI00273BCC69|nr:zinc finger protein 761-like [Phymastichus coffea]